MKVYVEPVGLHSTAMKRIAKALRLTAPSHVEIVRNNIEDADLVVFYPVGYDWAERFTECLSRGQQYAVVQCCLKTSGADAVMWLPWWGKAKVVWSYLDLVRESTCDFQWSFKNSSLIDDLTTKFYYAPLGVDSSVFFDRIGARGRNILTTGYVSGRPAEAIKESWQAANRTGREVVHIGSFPQGIEENELPTSICWSVCLNQTDVYLAERYSVAQFVSSLRYVEGFELPAAEGLCCGAQPVLFDQPDLQHWYGDLAVYVPELEGNELVDKLVEVFNSSRPVTKDERQTAKERFDWTKICAGFWERVLS